MKGTCAQVPVVIWVATLEDEVMLSGTGWKMRLRLVMAVWMVVAGRARMQDKGDGAEAQLR